MILVYAFVNLTTPDPSSTKLISISAFGEQNDACFEPERIDFRFCCPNELHFRQIKIPTLDVRNT